MDNKPQEIQLIQLSNYVKPEIKDFYGYGKKWMTNGRNNSFYQYVIDRKNGSPTNESVLNVYASLLYGRGIIKNGENEIYEELLDIFSKTEQRKVLNDYKIFGMFSAKLVRSIGGGIAKIKHFPIDKLAMGTDLDKDQIQNVWYSFDWTNTNKNKPIELPVFKGKMTDKEMILLHKPYQAGSFWFAYPDYMAALQYCEMEEEISNFSINHIQNGLSFGYVINFNNGGSISDEMKLEIENRIKQKLTGSSNAGKFILSFNDGKEAEVTVTPLNTNSDSHLQWESLRTEAKQQIITCHGVTSPMLFGIPTTTGFGSNADELNTASKLLQDYQIDPKQECFLDAFKPAFELAGLETDLEFLPLRESYSDEEKEEIIEDDAVEDLEVDEKLSNEINVDMSSLLSKGEDINFDEWELLEDEKCEEITLRETFLNTVFNFASVPNGDARKTSDQDTSLFKIRYRYAGNLNAQRQFCKKVISSNKVFRAEDLENAGVVNAGFGIEGADTYNIFLYKGGANCKHWWQRVIYLRKNNKNIGVNEARKMILALKPSERKDAKWQQNEKEVAKMPYDMPNNGYVKPRV
jgi:hypothetical protein